MSTHRCCLVFGTKECSLFRRHQQSLLLRPALILTRYQKAAGAFPDSAFAILQGAAQLYSSAEALSGGVGWPSAPGLLCNSCCEGHQPAAALEPGPCCAASHATKSAPHFALWCLAGELPSNAYANSIHLEPFVSLCTVTVTQCQHEL